MVAGMRTLLLITACVVPFAPAAFDAAIGPQQPAAQPAVRTAATRFVATLDDAAKAAAMFAWDVDERTNWQFVPGRYPGLALGAMTLPQRRAAHDLLRASLSDAGYLKTQAIFRLESTLRREAEAAGAQAEHRDPERYSFAVFGTPGDAPWGWRVQGHHISLNFTVLGDQVTVTPAFWGANPHEIRTGPLAGSRALGAEEDAGFALMASLDGDKRTAALLSDEAPPDVLLGPGTAADKLGAPRGVPASQLSSEQRRLLMALVDVYLDQMPSATRQSWAQRIERDGRGNLHFAWAGATQPGAGHYWRVHGPSFVIEYDNTQNDANHTHTVWRDLQNDFGGDLLREHLRSSHGR